MSYEGSIEFNMQSALQHWQSMANSNHGLVITVSDAFGTKLSPQKHIHQMDCSGKIKTK